jgi:phenylalanyl-tRNA synthetase beta chain
VIPYSFVDEKWPDTLRLASDDPRRAFVRIANPLSADQAVMRTMLLPGLLATAQRNMAVREERVHIFESGRVFLPSSGQLPEERTRAAILIHGPWEVDAWLKTNVRVDYYLVKGIVERLCGALGATLDYAAAEEPFLHPGKSAVVRDAQGRSAGWLGEVHPLVLQSYDLRSPAVAAELELDVLLDSVAEIATFRDLLAYPAVEQDLAVVVDSAVPAAQVVDCLRSAGGDLLENVAVFDLYEGAQVGAGKKSLALRVSFRAADRTLNEAEVSELRARIVKQLKQAVGGELRA